jgi:MFS family permease
MSLSPRQCITGVFFVNGALYASWVSRIPALSDRIGVDAGLLGLVLLAPALASAVAMPIAGRLLHRGSSRALCQFAMLGVMITVVLPGLTTAAWSLGAVLLLLGATNSTLDVSMNAQALSVERRLARPILSSVHAAFSFGGFAGAGLGALAAALDVAPLPHLIAASLLFGIPGLLVTLPLLADDEDPDAAAPTMRWHALPPRLILLGIACFFGLLAEGGAADWSAKLVRGEPAGSAAAGALAYAVFSIGMAAGRLTADALWARWGGPGLLRRAAALATVGFTAGLLANSAPVNIAGFLVLGLGLSGTVPTLFRSASAEPGVATGGALSAVSTLGYFGFLIGPPVIGGLAQLTSLRPACGVLALSALMVAVLARFAQTPSRAVPEGGREAAVVP